MNILLLQLKRIGDLILTTPAIAAVRSQFPKAEVTLVVAPGTRALLPAIPHLDHSLLAADWPALARRKFDVCVDFTHNDRSAFLTVLSRAPRRVSSAHVRLQAKLRALCYNRLVPSALGDVHTVDHYLGLLEPLGIRQASPRLRLQLPASARLAAERLLQENGIAAEFVLLHPGSARREKFWEAGRWREVIAAAQAEGLACVVTAGDSDLEREHLAAIRAGKGAPFVDLARQLDLLTLAALIEKARVVVTVDSAPAHFAAALQTPQVVLFGPTNPLHWRPRFSPAVILQAGSAAPLREFFREQPPAPMNLISTAQVIDGMKTLLATPRDAAPRHERT